MLQKDRNLNLSLCTWSHPDTNLTSYRWTWKPISVWLLMLTDQLLYTRRHLLNGSSLNQHDARFSIAKSKKHTSLSLMRSLIAKLFTRACSCFSILIFWKTFFLMKLWFWNGSQILFGLSFFFALSSWKRMFRPPCLTGERKSSGICHLKRADSTLKV